MEQKKLLTILRRDMSELEELISELKQNQADNIPEIRFLHTRTQGIRELIEILYTSYSKPSNDNVNLNKAKPLSYISEPINKEVKDLDEVDISDNDINIEDDKVEEDIKHEPQIETKPIKDIVTPKSKTISLDEKEETEHHKSLGESFAQRNTVNEKVSGNASISDKFNSSKIVSLRSSIGMNDKFLYIRELFDGDANKFENTISTLDSKNDLKDAVNYLSENFKWKKTDTSINFINLLKRRFINE